MLIRQAWTSFCRQPAETTDTATKESSKLFSNTPLELDFLSAVDGSARIDVEAITLNEQDLGSVSTRITLDSGGLILPTFVSQLADESISGSLSMLPDNDVFDVITSIDLSNWRSGFLAIEGQAMDTIPPFNGSLTLTGRGNSVHDIMVSADGQLTGRHDAGEVDLKAAGALFADVAASLVQSLNPLADSSANATLECGVYDITIANGLATVEQLSVQTDRLTVISSGEVELDSEVIDMAIRTKSREGLGLSIGSVATSFVKLGGTLSEPSINVDAGGTVTTTGAAVATGGLSVIAKGLWDRVSSEADLCKPAQADKPLPEP